MRNYMQELGVATVEEWQNHALRRAPQVGDSELRIRREAAFDANTQMALEGERMDDAMQADEELFLSGRMDAEEYRAYLIAKYQG